MDYRNKILTVYIMTNKNHTVLYTGVSGDLLNRVIAHREKADKKSFTTRYNVDKLVYYTEVGDPQEAIKMEKRIKAGSRQRKIDLINSMNPNWRDLFDDILPY